MEKVHGLPTRLPACLPACCREKDSDRDRSTGPRVQTKRLTRTHMLPYTKKQEIRTPILGQQKFEQAASRVRTPGHLHTYLYSPLCSVSVSVCLSVCLSLPYRRPPKETIRRAPTTQKHRVGWERDNPHNSYTSNIMQFSIFKASQSPCAGNPFLPPSPASPPPFSPSSPDDRERRSTVLILRVLRPSRLSPPPSPPSPPPPSRLRREERTLWRAWVSSSACMALPASLGRPSNTFKTNVVMEVAT